MTETTDTETTDLRCEVTFDVDRSPDQLWQELQALGVERSGGSGWWLPGFESRGEEVSVEPGRELIVTKAQEPCRGTTISVTFEHVATGSRIRIVQSGFDPGFVAMAGESFWAHADRILADAEVWFRTGVVAGRAWRAWAPAGVSLRDHSFGAVVVSVTAGSWAERAGLAEGDVLIEFAGAPVFSGRDLAVVEQSPPSGAPVTGRWIRDREVVSATAAF